MNIFDSIRRDISENDIYTESRSLQEQNLNYKAPTSELFGRALKDESFIGIAVDEAKQLYTDIGVDEDEKFTSSIDKYIEKDKNLIHEDFIDDLKSRAKNHNHYKELLEDYQRESMLEEQLDNSGWPGFGLRFASELTNIPAYIAPQYIAPKLAITLNTGLAGRTMMGGVEGIAFEYAKTALGDTERTNLELGLASAFGAGAGALFGNLSSDVFKIAQNDIKAKMRIDNKVEQKLISAPTKEEKDKILKEHFEKHKIGRQSDYEEELLWLQKRADEGTLNKGVASKLRYDLRHLTSKSESEIMRSFSKQHFKDTALQGNTTNLRTLNEEAVAIEEQIISKSDELFNPIVNEFATNVYGKNWLTSRWTDARTVISNIAGDMQQWRNLNPTAKDSEVWAIGLRRLKDIGVNHKLAFDLAKKIDKASGDLAEGSWDILNQYGKAGFNEKGIKKTRNYAPIVYSRNTGRILENKGLGKKQFKEFIKGSLISQAKIKFGSSYKLTDEDLSGLDQIGDLISDAMYKSPNTPKTSGDSYDDLIRGFFEDKKNQLRPEIKDFLFQEVVDNTKREGVFSRARSPLDYSYKQKFINEKGKEVVLSFHDLVNKNLLGTNIQYARKMGGATALEKTKFKFERTEYDFETAKNVKDFTVDIIKKIRGLEKDLEAIYSSNNLKYIEEPLKRIAKELGMVDFDISNLLKAKTKEEVEEINSLIANIGKDLENKIAEIFSSIKANIPDEYADKYNDILEFAKKSESTFRGYRATAHEIAEEFGGDVDKIYKDLLESNKETINEINNLQKSIFSKTIKEELSLGTKRERDIVISRMERELRDKGVDEKAIRADIVRINEIIDEYLGKPTSVDPFGLVTQALRIINNLNISRLLGATGITMTAEMGGVMFKTGVKNFMEFSSFKDLIKQLKTGKIDDRLAEEIQLHTGLGTAMIRDTNPNAFDHEFDISDLSEMTMRDRFMNKAEEVSARFADAVLMLGGVKPLTALGEIIIGKQVLDDIINIALKPKLKMSDIKNLNEMGIDEVMAKRIQSQLAELDKVKPIFVKKKWSNGHKVKELRFDEWTDDEAKMMLINAMRRISNNIVQKSMLGDKLGNTYAGKLFKNSHIGKVFLELKDYMITSYVAQLGRLLTRRDAYMLGMVMSQASALTLATVLQHYVTYAGNGEKLEERLSPENLLREIFSKLPASSYIPTTMDMVINTFTGERIFSPSRHQGDVQNMIMSFPTIDAIAKVQNVITETGKSIYGLEPTDGLIRNVFGITPLGNTIPARMAKEKLLEMNNDD